MSNPRAIRMWASFDAKLSDSITSGEGMINLDGLREAPEALETPLRSQQVRLSHWFFCWSCAWEIRIAHCFC